MILKDKIVVGNKILYGTQIQNDFLSDKKKSSMQD